MTESCYQINKYDINNRDNTYAIYDESPLTSFLYALKSLEARRQYPARLKKFFDYLEIKLIL